MRHQLQRVQNAVVSVYRWLAWQGRRLLGRFPQEGAVEYRYYRRTGYCNQCSRCCQDIYLVYGDKAIETEAEFKKLQAKWADYRHFKIKRQTEHGLMFECTRLKADGSCGIYESRPGFCRRYPHEDTLLTGGELATDCSYRFEPLKPFNRVLAQKDYKQGQKITMRKRPACGSVALPTHSQQPAENRQQGVSTPHA